MKHTNKISVVIITYNEAKNIARCIDSILSIADEIIVIDSYSTDATKNICSQYNATFIENHFEGHIQQKNFAIEQAKFDYVLSLDADECLDNNTSLLISNIKQNIYQYDCYSFNRLNNYCGKWIKHSGWYPDKKIRLWNKNKGKWGGLNPHDTVVMNKNSSHFHFQSNILHYSYKTVEEHVLQSQKFAKISAQADFEKGKQANIMLLFFKPKIKFLVDYFIKLGFLDGYYGYIICRTSGYAKYLKYLYLIELKRKLKK